MQPPQIPNHYNMTSQVSYFEFLNLLHKDNNHSKHLVESNVILAIFYHLVHKIKHTNLFHKPHYKLYFYDAELKKPIYGEDINFDLEDLESINIYTKLASRNPSATATDPYSYYFTLALNEDGASYNVKATSNTTENIVIPAKYKDLPVTKTKKSTTEEDGAFYAKVDIASLTIPVTMNCIEDFSFVSCGIYNIN